MTWRRRQLPNCWSWSLDAAVPPASTIDRFAGATYFFDAHLLQDDVQLQAEESFSLTRRRSSSPGNRSPAPAFLQFVAFAGCGAGPRFIVQASKLKVT
jgi:hypothetical protein